MSNRAPKPLVVLDFRCNLCGFKLDAVIVAKSTVPKQIVKSYHEACWKRQTATTKTGAN